MIILYITGIIISFFIGVYVGFNFSTANAKNVEKYSRIGVLEMEYVTSGSGKDRPIHVSYEVGEIERADTLSKIKVISYKASMSEYNNNTNTIGMVDNSWVKSDEIQWISTVSKMRVNKIDSILGERK